MLRCEEAAGEVADEADGVSECVVCEGIATPTTGCLTGERCHSNRGFRSAQHFPNFKILP